MQRFALLVVLIGLSTCSISGFAQGPTVQLCVAGMQVSGSAASFPPGRDLLIKALSKEKPDKALSIENVPIDQVVPEEALASAKKKSCDYVVTTNQSESHTDSSYWGGSNVNMPTFFLTTEYKLTKVSDGSDMSSGSFKASDRGSPQNAVGFTMKKVADKVTETIRKAGPVAK
jgi:hypothetical protein